jgi:hypothetical protein
MLYHTHLELTLTFLWLGFLLAISGLEVWVKFKAPFVRTHVAMDVERYVLAALHAVEVALVSVFWLGRLVLPTAAAAAAGSAVGGGGTSAGSNGAKNPLRTAPAGPWMVATGCVGVMIVVVAPRLYLRAKYHIVNALIRDPDDRQNQWTDREEAMLQNIAQEISQASPGRRPSAKWHTVYMLLEMIKITALITFLIGMM